VMFEHLLWMLENADPQPESLDELVDYYACWLLCWEPPRPARPAAAGAGSFSNLEAAARGGKSSCNSDVLSRGRVEEPLLQLMNDALCWLRWFDSIAISY
jgi:hypothetical protein